MNTNIYSVSAEMQQCTVLDAEDIAADETDTKPLLTGSFCSIGLDKQ